ncbi:nonsense-mediated mRNA decay factor SMG9-like [Oscarella lobularis]|uniref:nonsense-mediated mRNA decay factor SMG9-like n=1 Tax=Oscarella lobularis TaxID=121494 RepID=UPI0033144759
MGDSFHRGGGRRGRGRSKDRFDGGRGRGRAGVRLASGSATRRFGATSTEAESGPTLVPGSIMIKTRPDKTESPKSEEATLPSPPLAFTAENDEVPPSSDNAVSSPPSSSSVRVPREIYAAPPERGSWRGSKRFASYNTRSEGSLFRPLKNPRADGAGGGDKRTPRRAHTGGGGGGSAFSSSPVKGQSLSVGGFRTVGFALPSALDRGGGGGGGGGGSGGGKGSPGGSRHRMPHQVEAKPAKLVNDALHWDDRAGECLLEQSDFLVVGVLGNQGVGKSTVMSLLAGSRTTSSTKFFRVQSDEAQTKACHETVGIDMLVTTERVILLDTEPTMSPSILKDFFYKERWLPSDMLAEDQIQIESLQLATFLMSVCHVVIVVIDNMDVSTFRLLRAVQMMNCVSDNFVPQSVRQSTNEPGEKVAPHILFLYNNAGRELFRPTGLTRLHKFIYGQMAEEDDEDNDQSKLKWCSGVSLLNSGTLTFAKEDLTSELSGKEIDCNLFLLPHSSHEKEERSLDSVLTSSSLLPGYIGYPSYHLLGEALRNNLFHLPRRSFQRNTSFTESHWFHYAGRCWTAIKKASIFAEYAQYLQI